MRRTNRTRKNSGGVIRRGGGKVSRKQREQIALKMKKESLKPPPTSGMHSNLAPEEAAERAVIARQQTATGSAGKSKPVARKVVKEAVKAAKVVKAGNNTLPSGSSRPLAHLFGMLERPRTITKPSGGGKRKTKRHRRRKTKRTRRGRSKTRRHRRR